MFLLIFSGSKSFGYLSLLSVTLGRLLINCRLQERVCFGQKYSREFHLMCFCFDLLFNSFSIFD